VTISLPTKYQQYVDEKVKSGQFADSASVIVGALEMMQAQERLAPEDLEWLRREVQRGLDQLHRGESAPFDADQIKAEGRRLIESRKTS